MTESEYTSYNDWQNAMLQINRLEEQLAQVTDDRDTARAKCAEMRRALTCDDDDVDTWNHALSSDCGKGFVHVRELEVILKPKREWCEDDPSCVQCGIPLMLSDGSEWPDKPEAFLCESCAIKVVESIIRLVKGAK